jgi:hypothetical protein
MADTGESIQFTVNPDKHMITLEQQANQGPTYGPSGGSVHRTVEGPVYGPVNEPSTMLQLGVFLIYQLH